MRMTPTRRIVLEFLRSTERTTGRFPGTSQIAASTGVDPKTISNVMIDLTVAGIIVVTSRKPKGRYWTNTYAFASAKEGAACKI